MGRTLHLLIKQGTRLKAQDPRLKRWALCLGLWALCLGSSISAQTSLSGTVLDPSGAPVPDAAVRLDAAGAAIAEFRTSADGTFEVERPVDAAGTLRLVVTAAGFAQAIETVAADRTTITITLQPAAFFEAVNVTSSRTDVPRADPTVTMTVIPSAELLTSAAVTLDDALKMVPGFTLFRRTSSRTANPTAQGVALRGIGGTSPSRSLVLADGIPLNDAFGGWVYWNKVPQVAIDRLEVQRGSGSDLYGADAVGGVVQLLTLRPGRPSGRALLEGGTLGTGRVSLFGGAGARGWRYSAGGEWFTIDGYIPVAVEQNPGIAPRGPVDSVVGSAHRSALVSGGYQSSNGWRVDASGNVYSEDRQNGQPLSINTTASRQGSVEVAGGVGGGLISARGFGGTQDYHQTFTTVNAARTSEVINRDQQIPSTVGGLGAQWFRGWGRHTVLVGAEWRYVNGVSIEIPFVQGRPQATVQAGGTDQRSSAFLQDTIEIGDALTVAVGAHADRWTSESQATGFTKSSGSFNPRASAAYRLGGSGVTVRGAVYQGFRAPTLNEFYRSFSAGSTLTRPNEALDPERLTGGDLGLQAARGRASMRVTGFWNVLDQAITAITVSSTPTQIIRQRANADKVRADGVELEGDLRLPYSLSVTVASGITRSRFAGDTALRGKKVPQVPGYNVGAGVRYARQPWSASAQLRVTGPQFEDDQNVFTLRRATVVDVFAGRTLAGRINAFVAVENLFDSMYDVGRTPILTTGLPRAARAGVLITLP
jgi:outer membrane receptor protein involved in Fe transport